MNALPSSAESSGDRWVVLRATVSVATALLFASAPHPAEASPPLSVITSDTIPPAPGRLFERRVLFSPEYLNRIYHTVWRAKQPEVVVDIPPPDERGRVAAYARKYGISEILARQIVESALVEGIDPDLGFRLVRVESVFRPTARGPMGALGLTQLMPATARSIDRSLRTDAEILDPKTNLRTGFRYLRSMIERYGGDVRLGLLAYNRGTGSVDRALREGRNPENGYTSKVLGNTADRYTGIGLLLPN